MKVVVTGAEGLIGQVVCRYLAAKQHALEKLDLKLGHDLSDEKFVRDWFQNHPADALINLFALNDHVGSGRVSGKLMDIELESFRDYLEVNLVSLFSVCREFARRNQQGTIVNFASTYGLVSPLTGLYAGDEKHVAYGVSKAGVIQMTRHLAVHWAPRIRVNCIAPGGIRHGQSPSFVQAYSRHTPLGRMMDVAEIAPLTEFLISEGSSYCTGAVFCADGGWTAI